MKKKQRKRGAERYRRQREAEQKWDVYGTTQREGRGQKGREAERRGFPNRDRRVILTVGHTLVLDLQILVGPWTGVREDI